MIVWGDFMSEIKFVNAGYNVPEFKSLRFHWALNQHAFLYFQGPAIVGGKKIDSGACILYTKGTLHDYVTLSGFVNSYIGFHAPDELFSKLSVKTNRIIYPKNCGEINDVLREICRENSDRRHGYDEAINSLILRLLVVISRGTVQKSESYIDPDLKNKMITLRTKYLADIVNVPDINDIIRDSGLSRTRFYKLYSYLFHVSPKDDLIWARLKKARELISSDPGMKLYEVAGACGFNDAPHFFRSFKNRYGYTPKDYANAAMGNK